MLELMFQESVRKILNHVAFIAVSQKLIVITNAKIRDGAYLEPVLLIRKYLMPQVDAKRLSAAV